MLFMRHLLVCVYIARRGSIEDKLTGIFNKISKLPSIHPDYVRVTQTTDGLHPADLLAIVQDVNNRFDCLLLCKKHTHCMSTSYIPKGKLCLLSKSAMRVSKHMILNKDPSPIVSHYNGLLYEDELLGTLNPKPTLLGHGKPPAICGMNLENDQAFSNGRPKRIVDGWAPEPYTAPWVGLLLKDNKVRCTAFIVSKGATDKFSIWVLSAKHCFLNSMTDDEDDKINLEPFGLMFGVHDLHFFTQQIVYRKIAAIKLSPDEGIKPKDFALIRLNKPVRFNSYINGLCLPEQREMAELFDGAMCQTCGFGATRTDQEPAVGSSVLQCIDVMVQDPDFDHSMFSDWNSVVKFKSSGFGPFHRRSNVRRLSAIPLDGVTTSRSINAFQPADPLAIISDVKHHLDCSLLCIKHKQCHSSSYIAVPKLCLLSKTTLKRHEIKSWDRTLFASIYTELHDEDDIIVRNTRLLPNMQVPFLCGTPMFVDNQANNRQRRIVGGWTPEPYQTPWVGLLIKNGRVRCTVFLISKTAIDSTSIWALGAKHCFLDATLEEEDDKKLDLKPFSLLFGVHDLRVRTQRSILRTANEIFFPPDEGLKPKDIALIKLNKPVKFTGYINGLCLPDVMEEYQLSDETPCMTCGFGATDENAKPAVGSGVLQCIEVEAQESDLDHNLFGDWNSVVKLKAAAFGPFHGDSGSPIFCSSGSLWSFLFAIVTGGQRSVFKNAYMSAARIAYYMNFIEGKMRDDTCCAAS